MRYQPDIVVSRAIGVISRNPVRWSLMIGAAAFLVGGGLFSLVEDNASLLDGWYWATVVMPTVGFGDFSPQTIAGRWVYVYVVASGWFATLILGGTLAGRITERRIAHTGDLHNDFDDLIDQARSLRDRYSADEAHDDAILGAARSVYSAWDREDDRAVEIEMYRLHACLVANEKEWRPNA